MLLSDGLKWLIACLLSLLGLGLILFSSRVLLWWYALGLKITRKIPDAVVVDISNKQATDKFLKTGLHEVAVWMIRISGVQIIGVSLYIVYRLIFDR